MLVTKPADIEGATNAAACVVKTHQRLVEYLREGLTLSDIDAFVAKRSLNSMRPVASSATAFAAIRRSHRTRACR